jgi:hypothetical protein
MIDSIINFSDFLKGRDNFTGPIPDSADDIPVDSLSDTDIKEVEELNDIEEELVDVPTVEDEVEIQQEEIIKENVYIPKEEKIQIDSNDDRYKVFKDKDEVFSCNIELEGVSIDNTKVRLVLETKNWNLVFNGDIDSNGRVSIPIKKLSILDESSSGKIKMEVIADENIFTPWEQDFVVKVSKKVMVKFDENHNTSTNKSKPSVRIIK